MIGISLVFEGRFALSEALADRGWRQASAGRGPYELLLSTEGKKMI